ncbi:NAD(P)H-binding protein [Streptomyces sp. bgisy034]|uniref:NAD(P)H-binding protein n=1 Tax=Streptomyces sp. bgisy034 TaxID=3413774 RepID=UPI003EBDC017
MKLLVLGATGPTGRHLVDLALRSGDTITALARNPDALADAEGRITVVAGDATAQCDVAAPRSGRTPSSPLSAGAGPSIPTGSSTVRRRPCSAPPNSRASPAWCGCRSSGWGTPSSRRPSRRKPCTARCSSGSTRTRRSPTIAYGPAAWLDAGLPDRPDERLGQRHLPCRRPHADDVTAARNILAAGLAASACGDGVRPQRESSRTGQSSVKQEPQRATAGIPRL